MKIIKELNVTKGVWILFVMLLSGAALYAQDATLAGPSVCGAASTSGTWIVPCDVTSITVEVYGGGGGAGGGGGGSNGGAWNTRGGGGGGAGGYSTITIDVTPGSPFTYSAAQGGCGGSNGSDWNSGGNGNGGGTSTFSGLDAYGNSILLTANGGGRGSGGSGTGGSTGSGGAGGTATGGSTNITGSSGNNGSGGTGGIGGAASGPNGGAGGASDGGAGNLYGAGGGGGQDSKGGAGATGGILITYVTQGALEPDISIAPASCTDDGIATVNNYNAALTYTFTPSGPAVGIGGVISGMIAGTDYTIIASIGACTSAVSLPFGIDEQLATPTISISGVLEYCEGSNTAITASGAQNYTWDDLANSTTAEIIVTQGTYTVTGTDAGCSAIATVTVTEVPFPIVDLGADQHLCGQATITLDAGAGATSYNWSSGDNTQTAELGAGTHWVEASNGDCSASDTIVIIQSQSPEVQVTPSGNLTICDAENITLDAGSGYVSYLWLPNGEQTQTISVSASGSYLAYVVDSVGCDGNSDTVTVTQMFTPIVDLGADQQVCGQTTITLDAGAGATSYNWSSGDNTQTAELGAGTHWVEASNGACSASDTIVITENQNPEPQITPSGNLTICDAGNVTLDVGSGYVSYLWQPNGEQTQTISVSASGSYSVYVVDSAGCDGNSDIVTVTLVNVTDAVISANGPLEICQGESVLLDAGSGYDTYLWSNGATTQSTSVGASGDYSVTGTLGGCLYTSDTVTVMVTTFVPEITASGTELTVTGGGYSSYQWLLNGDPIPGATDPNYNAIASGNYTVVVTDDSGCSGQSQILEYTLPPVSGLSELDAVQPFLVYPNPSNGQFQIEMETSGSYTIEVMNMMGQMVYAEEKDNGNRSFINLEANGMYLIKVVVEGQSYHKRLVVQ